MALCVWHLLLSMMFSRLIHVVAGVSILSLLLPNNISLYGYTTFCLSVYPLTDIWVVSFMAIMKNAAVSILVQVFVWTYAFISHGRF